LEEPLMYRPKAFAVDDLDVLHDAIERSGPAHLVSVTAAGLIATVVPLLLDRLTGPRGTLVGHVARANPHWREARPDSASMAIFPGLDAYISPSWYPTKRDTGKVVPTWNYEVIHASGELVVHDDPTWVEALVRRLTERHEAGLADRWSVDDAPTDFIGSQLRAIVGIELRITALEGKQKLSQNRPVADVEGAITGLSNGSARDRAVADRMHQALALRSPEQGSR
jgi:transcriptional regulator